MTPKGNPLIHETRQLPRARGTELHPGDVILRYNPDRHPRSGLPLGWEFATVQPATGPRWRRKGVLLHQPIRKGGGWLLRTDLGPVVLIRAEETVPIVERAER